MTRPRIAAVISAAAASTAAFLVVSRWGLFGTVAGTVVFTMIHTFVSHWSTEGLTHLGGRLRRTKRGGAAAEGADEPAIEATDGVQSPALVTSEQKKAVETRGSQGRFGRMNVTQWLLAASALVAVGFSVYAVTSPPVQQTLETVVYRDQVIEKTVTVTTEPGRPVGSVYPVAQVDGSTSATSPVPDAATTVDAGADQSTGTAETTSTSNQPADSSSTTVATDIDGVGAGLPTVPTTDDGEDTVNTTNRTPGTVTTSPVP